MGLLSRLKNAETIGQPVLPRHDQVADAKYYEIIGQGRLSKRSKYGFGIVLIDLHGQQSPAYLIGQKPETVNDAITDVLGPFGPLPRRYRAPQLFNESDVSMSGVFKQDLLIAKLEEQPTISEMQVADSKREQMAKLVDTGGLRPTEHFTPIAYTHPSVEHAPFGTYDLVD